MDNSAESVVQTVVPATAELPTFRHRQQQSNFHDFKNTSTFNPYQFV
jgi:hypothetical protein